DAAQRDGADLRAARLERAAEDVQAGEAAGARDQAAPPRAAAELEGIVVHVVHRQPPWAAVSTSTRWPAARRTSGQRARGTTLPSRAMATPRGSAGRRRVSSTSTRLAASVTSWVSPLSVICMERFWSGPEAAAVHT